MPAALSAIRGSLTAAPVPRVLEEALAANALNALADEPPTELATLSPDSAKWQKRGKTTPKSNSGSFAPMHGGVDVSLPENKGDKRGRRCREALEAFNARDDHPSAEDVLAGRVGLRTALAKGFKVRFGGQRDVLFTDVLLSHYDNPDRDEAARLALIRPILQERNNLMPGPHHGRQIVLIGQKRLAPLEKKHVVIADEKTGVAVNVMLAQQNYCDKHFKQWRRR